MNVCDYPAVIKCSDVQYVAALHVRSTAVRTKIIEQKSVEFRMNNYGCNGLHSTTTVSTAKLNRIAKRRLGASLPKQLTQTPRDGGSVQQYGRYPRGAGVGRVDCIRIYETFIGGALPLIMGS